MKKSFKEVVCLLTVLSFVGNYSLLAQSAIAKVPLGTPVTLKLMETISSKGAQVGQRVKFVVESDVIVTGRVVIKKGAAAIGEVIAASAAGMAGTAGQLTISIQTVQAVDGSLMPISSTKGAKGQSKLAASVAITALCCIFAIFMKGKDVTFFEGSIYNASTIAPIEVKVE